MNEYKFSFEKLEIWQLSVELSVDLYKMTKDFPSEEKYGITSQIRRAANSIGANIAEGSGRKSTKEKSRYIEIAYGSLLEVLSFLQVSERLGFISKESVITLRPKIEKVSNKLNAYNRSLNR